MATKENATQALQSLAKHFGLEWTGNEITTYLNNNLEAITYIYGDKINRYFINFNRQNIKIGEINAWSKHEFNLNRLTV